MMDKFIEKAYMLADEQIEKLVIDSLQKNNYSIQEAIKKPSKIIETNPYFMHSILTYIYQSVYYLLSKLEEQNIDCDDEEPLRFFIKREILNIHYENHKKYIDSSDPDIREEHLKKLSELSKKIDDLEKQKINNNEEKLKSSINTNSQKRNKMLEFAGGNYRNYSDEKIKIDRREANTRFRSLLFEVTISGFYNKKSEIRKYKLARVITLSHAELEKRGYKLDKDYYPDDQEYKSELARLQEFGTLDEYIVWLNKQTCY